MYNCSSTVLTLI